MTNQQIDPFIEEIEQALLRRQEPIAVLKLAAYAIDAMRVLLVFERNADMSSALAHTLKSICPDWRNPGSVEQPADLIAVALNHAVFALQHSIQFMERVVASRPTASPAVGGSFGGTSPPD